MDKEDVVHICDGILLSHQMEQNCALCRCRRTRRRSYKERSEREKKQTLYDIISVWNPEENGTDELMYKRETRDTDVENKLMDNTQEGRWDELGD